MTFRNLDCIAVPGEPARKLHAVTEAGRDAFLSGLPAAQAGFLKESGFTAASGEVFLLPGPDGAEAAVLGLGATATPWPFGAAATKLPVDSAWSLVPGEYRHEDAVLGFCLGAYTFDQFRKRSRKPVRLVVPAGAEAAIAEAEAIWMARDLVNTPANLLGPAELADMVVQLAARFGGESALITGAEMAREYPAAYAVGRGSARPPVVAKLRWRGSKASDSAPLIALCGKGVCFDSGGYDLKPSTAMLRMKKDMGGAAVMLGVARLIMQADLPVRLALRIGCVENMVSGDALRPLDVIQTRRGLTVEVGNTDAEGRLVLCDLIADACDDSPDLLIDAATLTGAARVALGPDFPALFSNNDLISEALLLAGRETHDTLWRLPLVAEYESWLKSPVADISNVSSRPHAGAIVAANFLQRFVTGGVRWAHLDTYCWNDLARPGRPEGGEAQGMRAIWRGITSILHPNGRG